MENTTKTTGKTVNNTLTRDELQRDISQDGDLLVRLQQKLKKNWKNIKEYLALLG